ncbi:MAG: PQQ-binding-like beta-propeller repeat protein [Bryobacterales bacterium]|nr:PQQ-binding-like beta-propeller repeat protein [Bryobacterales bacterium]
MKSFLPPVFTLILALGALADEQRGKQHFVERCAACHGADGAGGERGPSIAGKIAIRTDAQLRDLIHNGLPGAGMPGTRLGEIETRDLIEWLRAVRVTDAAHPAVTVDLGSGRTLSGTVRARGQDDMQLQGEDGKVYLLRKSGNGMRVAGAAGDRDWPTYHGELSGNRHTPLTQIDTKNVADLRVAWLYSAPGWQRLEVTPVVVSGMMYVTSVNEVHALDAGTGRLIWRYRRPRTRGLVGDAAGGINRGVAFLGDSVFMVTDHAHLISLNRWTGSLLWDVEMADHRENYGATGAPLIAGGVVISGVSGGDEGARGFVAAYKPETGERVWRFWTIPQPGEPLAETWKGTALLHGCGATWMTGTYDPSLDLLYWSVGNPCPDYNGDERRGDNLYTDSILALQPSSGKLRWHYQFTPHDVHDWDAQQTPMLLDAEFGGRPRRLLVQANRNGFWYVLDRASGEFLLAKPFVKKLTWAKEIGKDGRPVLLPGADPAPEGTRACPAVEGATNWFSTAYHPGLRLFYVQALEKCGIYSKSPGVWQAGKSYYDGASRDVPGEPGRKVLRALDLDSGRVVWEAPQAGPGTAWGGVLSTASGLVFSADDDGALVARDARTGARLWEFPANQLWKASPMSYQFDGRQYVTIAAGGAILAFSLPHR